MNTPTTHRARAAAFDDLLMQISGELALTPASETLDNAPFLDIEPDPEPQAAAPEVSPTTTAPRRAPARGWAAGGMALVLGLAGFLFGSATQSQAEREVVAMNMASAHAERDAEAHHEGLLELRRAQPEAVIPHGPAPLAASLPKAPEPEAEKASETTKKATKPRRKTRAKAKPKKKVVSFEDL